MNSLPLQAILGGAAAILLAVIGAAVASPAVVLVPAALACVAFAAQRRLLSDEDRLVYRPVHARRQDVRRRVRSDD